MQFSISSDFTEFILSILPVTSIVRAIAVCKHRHSIITTSTCLSADAVNRIKPFFFHYDLNNIFPSYLLLTLTSIIGYIFMCFDNKMIHLFRDAMVSMFLLLPTILVFVSLTWISIYRSKKKTFRNNLVKELLKKNYEY